MALKVGNSVRTGDRKGFKSSSLLLAIPFINDPSPVSYNGVSLLQFSLAT